jgi:type VI secretion system ImpC/EvpB family protein
MAGRLEFDLDLGRAGRRRDPGDPMRLLVIGDFSGRPPSERPPLASRPTPQVDIETLDLVMHRLGTRLRLSAGEMSFRGLDDFHPDQLYARLDLFQALRQARTNPPAVKDDLGRLLGRPNDAGASPAAALTGLDALIGDIVAPHIVRDTAAEAKPYLAAVDAAIAEQMRALLHDPAFQSLESAWRGLHWLASSLELDDGLRLHLFDVTRDELLADFVSAGDTLAQTALHHALVDRGRNLPAGDRWSVVVALISFGPSDSDIGLLSGLGLLASQAGAPMLAGGDTALAESDPGKLTGWRALRRSEAAPWIGLAAPRVLLRLPYGQRSDPIDAFSFEEIVGEPAHEEFLWGSGSLAAALLIGRSFTAKGWEMEPGDEREIGDLPAYTFLRDGEQEMQACAERYLSESQTETLLKGGLIPLVSRRDRNAIVAGRFQSVADPPAPLAW